MNCGACGAEMNVGYGSRSRKYLGKAWLCEKCHNDDLSERTADDIRCSIFCKRKKPTPELVCCPDCGVEPGNPHRDGCDVERCSVCGGQRFGDNCEGHDKAWSRWAGIWPGGAEADYLGIDMSEFYRRGLHKIFFVKPIRRDEK